jgi:hypothetical protein
MHIVAVDEFPVKTPARRDCNIEDHEREEEGQVHSWRWYRQCMENSGERCMADLDRVEERNSSLLLSV